MTKTKATDQKTCEVCGFQNYSAQVYTFFGVENEAGGLSKEVDLHKHCVGTWLLENKDMNLTVCPRSDKTLDQRAAATRKSITCEVCGSKETHRHVDGKTKLGPWATMCAACHRVMGVGLGTGRGQLYDTQSGTKLEG